MLAYWWRPSAEVVWGKTCQVFLYFPLLHFNPYRKTQTISLWMFCMQSIAATDSSQSSQSPAHGQGTQSWTLLLGGVWMICLILNMWRGMKSITLQPIAICNTFTPQIRRICSATNLTFPSLQDIIMRLPCSQGITIRLCIFIIKDKILRWLWTLIIVKALKPATKAWLNIMF